jgi:DNA-binding FadR family transcriptional regulator
LSTTDVELRDDELETSVSAQPKPLKAAERVADELRKEILTEGLDDGALLGIESEIVERFNISRPTAREALRILEIEALVRLTRGNGGGIVVQRPDINLPARYFALLLQMGDVTIGEVYAARSVIGPPAARILATRRDPEAIRELRELNVRAAELTHERDRFGAVMVRFHDKVVELTGNRTLELFVEMLHDIVERSLQRATRQYVGEGETVEQLQARALERHRRLVDLIEAGDADEAEEHWRMHLEDFVSRVMTGDEAERVVDPFGYR